MEVDDENDSAVHYRNININNRNVNNSGINSFESFVSPSTLSTTQSLNRRLAPNSIGLQMTPTKMLLSQTRRSSSGIFITSMFGSRFRHLQKLHSDAFLGLNAVCLPGLPVGAVFRSSLPATPVATPIHREAFQQFSEQAIRERLCKTPSPRKNRGFLALAFQQQQSEDHSSHRNYQMETGQSCGHDNSPSDVQPMDITSPVIDEPVIEDVKEEDNTNGAGFGEHYFGHNERLQRTPSVPFNDRRLFVANIGYRVRDDKRHNFE